MYCNFVIFVSSLTAGFLKIKIVDEQCSIHDVRSSSLNMVQTEQVVDRGDRFLAETSVPCFKDVWNAVAKTANWAFGPFLFIVFVSYFNFLFGWFDYRIYCCERQRNDGVIISISISQLPPTRTNWCATDCVSILIDSRWKQLMEGGNSLIVEALSK